MSALQRPLTYDDLLELPDDGIRREIIGGELIVTPAPAIGHQRVLRNLFRMLDAYTRAAGGEVLVAPVDVKLGHFDVVQPDLVFMSASKGRLSADQQAIEEPPSLVVEIISPGSKSVDRIRKMALYARSGVPEYWIVDPEHREVTVYTLDGPAYGVVEPHLDGTIASRELPDLAIDLADVFAGLDG